MEGWFETQTGLLGTAGAEIETGGALPGGRLLGERLPGVRRLVTRPLGGFQMTTPRKPRLPVRNSAKDEIMNQKCYVAVEIMKKITHHGGADGKLGLSRRGSAGTDAKSRVCTGAPHDPPRASHGARRHPPGTHRGHPRVEGTLTGHLGSCGIIDGPARSDGGAIH